MEKLGKFEESDVRFNEKLWICLVDFVTAPSDDEKALIFHLKFLFSERVLSTIILYLNPKLLFLLRHKRVAEHLF